MLAMLFVWSEVQMTCTWSGCSTVTSSSLASVTLRMIYSSGTGEVAWKKAVKRVLFVVVKVEFCTFIIY